MAVWLARLTHTRQWMTNMCFENLSSKLASSSPGKQFAHDWHLPCCQCMERCSRIPHIQNYNAIANDHEIYELLLSDFQKSWWWFSTNMWQRHTIWGDNCNYWNVANAMITWFHFIAACTTRHTITLTSQWPCWRLKSPASRLFTLSFIQA